MPARGSSRLEPGRRSTDTSSPASPLDAGTPSTGRHTPRARQPGRWRRRPHTRAPGAATSRAPLRGQCVPWLRAEATAPPQLAHLPRDGLPLVWRGHLLLVRRACAEIAAQEATGRRACHQLVAQEDSAQADRRKMTAMTSHAKNPPNRPEGITPMPCPVRASIALSIRAATMQPTSAQASRLIRGQCNRRWPIGGVSGMTDAASGTNIVRESTRPSGSCSSR